MGTTDLIRAALITSIIGIAALYVLAENIEISSSSIKKMSGEEEAKIVEGIVLSIDNREKSTSFKISNEVQIIAFSKVELEKGDRIRVIAKESDGRLIAEKIIRLD